MKDEDNASEKSSQSGAVDNLDRFVPDDEIMSHEQLREKAQEHYQARYQIWQANKNRRRSTISRKFSMPMYK